MIEVSTLKALQFDFGGKIDLTSIVVVNSMFKQHVPQHQRLKLSLFRHVMEGDRFHLQVTYVQTPRLGEQNIDSFRKSYCRHINVTFQEDFIEDEVGFVGVKLVHEQIQIKLVFLAFSLCLFYFKRNFLIIAVARQLEEELGELLGRTMLSASVPLIRAELQENVLVQGQVDLFEEFAQFVLVCQALADLVQLGILLVLAVPDVDIHYRASHLLGLFDGLMGGSFALAQRWCSQALFLH